MGKYRYETHMHTSEGSACGVSTGREQALRYKEAGFTGMVVTDHFFNGNCAIPKGLSWEERVERFCLGYENAKKAGEEIGLDVFFGWEANYRGTEFLIYGLDKAFLLDHPEMEFWTVEEQYEKVKAAGGVVVQAHPFRDAIYIPAIHLYPYACDAVEGMNRANRFPCNAYGVHYAREHHLPMTAGSDCHIADDHEKWGILTEERAASGRHLAQMIREGKVKTSPEASEEGYEEGIHPFAVPAFYHDRR